MKKNESNNIKLILVTLVLSVIVVSVMTAFHWRNQADIARSRVLTLREQRNHAWNMLENFKPEYVIDTVYKENPSKTIIYAVKGTRYSPVIAQTDSTPFVTADGSRIDSGLLESGNLRWLAISPDIHNKWMEPNMLKPGFDYGDTIYVYHNNRKLRGLWIVRDIMNPKCHRQIDFLFPESHPKVKGLPGEIIISNKQL